MKFHFLFRFGLGILLAFAPWGIALAEDKASPRLTNYTCPTTSSRSYSSGIIFQFDNDDPVRPAWNHADKNLALRSYSLTSAPKNLVNLGSDDPIQPPQLATLFAPSRVPIFSNVYRANTWNWAQSPDPGTPGGPITDWPVTVIGMQTAPGEPLRAPTHGRDIGAPFGTGGSMIIFADADSLTLHFTREDTAAVGYTVHIDNICTDPNLLALYNSLDNTARNTYSAARPYSYNLPGLTAGQILGVARDTEIRVALVDTGAFMDPRSQFEWWQIGGGATVKTPADFNGDSTSDVVVYRGGAWLFHDFVSGAQTGGTWTGNPGACIPAPMDYDGDNRVEFTQLCAGAWHFYNDDGSYNKGIWTGGVAGDLPVPADYSGDSRDEVAIWRNGAWLFYDFTTGNYLPGSSVWTGAPPHWTGGADVPVPMDYDGDGKADFTVYAGGPWHFFNDNGSYNSGIWTGGVAGDIPVAGDYNGIKKDQPVVFRAGAWLYFDFVTGAATYSVWTGAPPHWTGGTSLPAPLDYDGDGRVEFTVFSGGPWHFYNDDGTYNKGIWTGGVAGDQGISRRLLP